MPMQSDLRHRGHGGRAEVTEKNKYLRVLWLGLCVLCVQKIASAASFDHVAAIKGLNEADLARGQKLYTQHCVACHGADGNLTQNPLARSFARDELKFGADPYSLWKTISYGNGLMFRWDAVLTEAQRYQLVHYIRETFLRRNGTQYSTPDAGYFAE